MRIRAFVAAASACVAALGLAACTDDDPDPSSQEDAMYCELIDPDTVQPITGDGVVKDFGGPVPKDQYRTVKCTLSSDRSEELLTVFEFELFDEQKAADERAKVEANMAKREQEGAAHYVALEAGDDLGYAWYTGEVAAANLLTAERMISVTAPATEAQAAEFTPVVLKVAQEIDANLDAWDEDNPS